MAKKGLDTVLNHPIVPWIVPVGFLLIWQFLSQVGWLSNRVLPAPTDVLQAAIKLGLSGE